MNIKNNIDKSKINLWYTNKTKLYKIDELQYLLKYIVKTDENIYYTINYSIDYKFSYLDLEKINCKKINVRPENIFKINFSSVITNMKKYFKNIKIKILFESPSENDILIKKTKYTYKHDVYIKISNELSFYDIGLEYFEIKHDRIKDNDKEISSKINLDGYYIYNEKDNSYNKFMKETIYSLFLGICAISDNPYILSKINFFKNYNNNKKLKKDSELFNNIIKWKQENSFNLKNFFDNADKMIDPDTENELNFEEFLILLKDNNIKIIYLDKKYNCEYKFFVMIIMNINNEYSDIINSFRDLYSKTMEILFESEKEILNWIKKSNETKRLIPKYIDYFLLNHIKGYRCKHTLEKVKSELLNR